MDGESLVASVTGHLELYAMNGQLNPDVAADTLADAAFGERVTGFDELLMLHFLLHEETREFAAALPQRLRALRTGTKTERQLVRSEVSEQIDWERTMRQRYATTPNDRTLFVTRSRREDYDLPENLVLRATTELLRRGLDEWETELSTYDWGTQWADDVLTRTQRVVAQQPNLMRIREPEPDEPTASMLATAANSRHTLYRSAADRYTLYQSITGSTPDRDRLATLLQETLLVPIGNASDPHRRLSGVFELYVLYTVIDACATVFEQAPQLRPIDSDRNAVAAFELDDDTTVHIYYEQAGTDAGLSFMSGTDRASDLTRRESVERRYAEIARDIGLGGRVTTNRPDVLVAVERDGKIDGDQSLMIEAKYQSPGEAGEQTIRRGIREALEYVAYMRADDSLVHDVDGEWYGVGTQPHAMLVVNDHGELDISTTTEELLLADAREFPEMLSQQLRTRFSPLMNHT